VNHLVLRREGNELSSLSILDSDVILKDKFDSWALINGTQIIFVNNKMHPLLKNYYMSGSYSTKALYLYSYEELYAILTVYLGPSDAVRYEQLVQAKRGHGWFRYELASYFAVKSVSFAGQIFWMSLKFIGLMLIIPFVISIFKRTSHK
jgi:hypothetical protein